MKFRALLLLLALCMAQLGANPVRARDAGAPPTRVSNVTDSYQGVSVVDPYRWLEDANDKAVHDWSLAQDARTRAYLDALPQRQAIFRQMMRQVSATSSSFYGLYPVGNRMFAYFNQPPHQQPMIAVLGNDADPSHARVVVDPNIINSKGTTAIDWFVPSPDGTLVAVSLSVNGSEAGSLHLFEVASGRQVGETIARVQYPTGRQSGLERGQQGVLVHTLPRH